MLSRLRLLPRLLLALWHAGQQEVDYWRYELCEHDWQEGGRYGWQRCTRCRFWRERVPDRTGQRVAGRGRHG